LIGDGPGRPTVEDRLRQSGLFSRTIFTGLRADVPDLLQAMDVFLFPSLWEGLPLTVLEAQAAGLPCIISDIISDETDVVPDLIRRVPLAAPASVWASAVLASAQQIRGVRQEALALVASSSFNIRNSLRELYALYGV
jgi:glycosyltransferase involved in cell wall biosynthesis